MREAIRSALALRAGGASSASDVAEATRGTWGDMSVRLASLIGVRGVDVLCGRALHLTGADFPWLGISAERGDSAAALAGFSARIETCEPALALEASSALLGKFTDLLATLIGDSLTERVLAPVIASAPAQKAPERESAP